MRENHAVRTCVQGALDGGGGGLSAGRHDVQFPIEASGVDPAQDADQLQQQGKPTVFMDVLSSNDIPIARTCRCLRVDDAAIGRAAARHFLSLGNFRSFAFVHDPRDEIWTRERQAAFATTLAEAGYACKTFTSSATAAETAAPHTGGARLSRPHELPAFLRDLPLPVAVLAASDLVAADVLRLADVRFVERESTKPLPPATRLVDRALAFIAANHHAPITPRDVATHLGVSRRLIDLRFRQLQHETLLSAITRLRLNALCNLLKEESGSLKKLTAECGFGSVVRAAHLFKGTFGLSMSAYRKHH